MSAPPPFGAPGEVAVVGYAVAHFGKSLWWNASELFLAFYLTEHLALDAIAAAGAIAAGLLVGAALDVAVARHPHWFASVARAGRLQAWGAFGSLLALLLLVAATAADGGIRLGAVVGANLAFRVAYVFYDLPQNCLLSLIDWPRDRQRAVAAWRTAAGATALIAISTMVSVYGADATRGREAALLVATAAAIALGSALWLWRATRGWAEPRRRLRAVVAEPLGPTLALMAIVCLTVPAFSKFAPYLAAYAAPGVPLLIVIGGCTVGSQPAWLALMRRRGERRAARIAGVLMVMAAVAAAAGALGAAAVAIGVASGGLGTAIWAGFAAAVVDADPLAAAPAFARLTATAKIALALAALAMGAILDGVDYRGDAMRLVPVLTALMLAGGIGVIAATRRGSAIRSGRRAGSA